MSQNIILEFYETLIHHYGESRVDLQDDNYIVIYYPEIHITSEKGATYTRKDIYVRISLNVVPEAEYLDIDIHVGSSSFSDNELDFLFILPHVNNDSLGFNSICYGLDSRLINAISLLSNHAYSNEDISSYILSFIYCLEEFLSYQSDSGGPYVSINHFIKNQNPTSGGLNAESILPEYLYTPTWKHYPLIPYIKEAFIKLYTNNYFNKKNGGSGGYIFSVNTSDLILRVSKLAIDSIYENKDSKAIEALVKYVDITPRIKEDGSLSIVFDTSYRTRCKNRHLIGNTLCYFKGNEVKTTLRSDCINDNNIRIMSYYTILYYLNRLELLFHG